MLEIKNINKTFGKDIALSNVSSTINNGTVYGLIGSNGSGKTTLLRIIAGVYSADSGAAYIGGKKVGNGIFTKTKVLFFSDDPYRTQDATAHRMGKMYSVCYPRWDKAYYQHICNILKVDMKKKFTTQSKGMQRHVLFALALAARPEILLFDEPFDGLDSIVKNVLKDLIREQVKSDNMTAIISSHNLRELEDLCDLVGIMHDGKLLMEKKLTEIKKDGKLLEEVFAEEMESIGYSYTMFI